MNVRVRKLHTVMHRLVDRTYSAPLIAVRVQYNTKQHVYRQQKDRNRTSTFGLGLRSTLSILRIVHWQEQLYPAPLITRTVEHKTAILSTAESR